MRTSRRVGAMGRISATFRIIHGGEKYTIEQFLRRAKLYERSPYLTILLIASLLGFNVAHRVTANGTDFQE